MSDRAAFTWESGQRPPLRDIRATVPGLSHYVQKRDDPRPYPVRLGVADLALYPDGRIEVWRADNIGFFNGDIADTLKNLAALSELGLRWTGGEIAWTEGITYHLRPWADGPPTLALEWSPR